MYIELFQTGVVLVKNEVRNFEKMVIFLTYSIYYRKTFYTKNLFAVTVDELT